MNILRNRAWIIPLLASLGHPLLNAAPASEPGGSVSLYESDNSAHPFGMGDQWGRPMEYNLWAYKSPIGPSKAKYISFLNVPSATRIFLSSDATCARNQEVDFWMELVATREASYPNNEEGHPMPISDLAGTGENESLGGIQVTEKHIKLPNGHENIACVRLTTSRRPGQVLPSVPLAFHDRLIKVPPLGYQACEGVTPVLRGRDIDHLQQHELAEIMCGTNERAHLGEPIQSAELPWRDTPHLCPLNMVITGIHIYSEIPTYFTSARLTCAALLDKKDRELWLQPDDTFHMVGMDRQHSFECPDSKVLIGIRTDANREIGYRCATVLAYPDLDPTSLANTGNKADTGKITFFNTNYGEEHKTYVYSFPDYGITRQFELRNYLYGFPFYDGDEEKLKIERFSIENMAPATTITFASDPMCTDTGDFSATLRSIRANAGTPQMNVADLFKASVGTPVENGLELTAKKGVVGSNPVRCVRVMTSRRPGQVLPVPFNLAVAGGWHTFDENDHSFTCPTGVLSGRGHEKDENGPTRYQCSTADGLALTPTQTYGGIEEHSSTWFVCPVNQALVGRDHQGDEKGNTTYHCAGATFNGLPVTITPNEQWNYVVEDHHEFRCANGEALIGRWHQGDTESRNVAQEHSAYRCGKVLHAANTGSNP